MSCNCKNNQSHPCQSGGECQCGGKCKQNGYLNAPGKWYYDNMADESKVRVTSEVRKPLPKTNKTPWVMTKAEIETFNNSAYGQHLAALNTPAVVVADTPTTTTAGFMGVPNLVWIVIGLGALYYGHQKGMFKKILK